MKISSLVSLSPFLATAIHAAPAASAVKELWQSDRPLFLENIAARHNGQLLITTVSEKSLFTFDPQAANPSPQLLTNDFGDANTLTGIAEPCSDLFVINTSQQSATGIVPNSTFVYTVDLRSGKPVTKQIVNIHGLVLFNGLTTLPWSNEVVLSADSTNGHVWSVNIRTGAAELVITDPLLESTGTTDFPLGINGLHVRGEWLYFTNSDQGFFGRVKIDRQGKAKGPIEKVAEKPAQLGGMDDFALGENGDVWVAVHSDGLLKIGAGGKTKVFQDAALLEEPTAAAFGKGLKDKYTLYVVTGGPLTGATQLHGQVLAVDTRKF